MVARRGLDRWWFNNCLNGKWAHLCKLAGKARGAWEQEQERERGRGRERERAGDSEGWEAADQGRWTDLQFEGLERVLGTLTDEEKQVVLRIRHDKVVAEQKARDKVAAEEEARQRGCRKEPTWFTKACERFAKTGSCREDAAEEDSEGWEATDPRRARRWEPQEEKWRKGRMEARRRDRLRSRVGYGAELTMEQAMERRAAGHRTRSGEASK